MAKKIAAVVLAGAVLAISLAGCTTKIQVIENGSSHSADRQSMSSGFNDETYIWESWSFSTNRVDK